MLTSRIELRNPLVLSFFDSLVLYLSSSSYIVYIVKWLYVVYKKRLIKKENDQSAANLALINQCN